MGGQMIIWARFFAVDFAYLKAIARPLFADQPFAMMRSVTCPP